MRTTEKLAWDYVTMAPKNMSLCGLTLRFRRGSKGAALYKAPLALSSLKLKIVSSFRKRRNEFRPYSVKECINNEFRSYQVEKTLNNSFGLYNVEENINEEY